MMRHEEEIPTKGAGGGGPVEPNKTNEEIRGEPYTLPQAFEWSLLDILDPIHQEELHQLLNQNYIDNEEDIVDKGIALSVRFQYSKEYLLWALTPPGYTEEFLLGVRASSKNASNPKKLVAFVSAFPSNIKFHDTPRLDVVKINYLCVHKKLRSKRLAPVLIKEITRRANLLGIFQAVYTAEVVLPGPFASVTNYYRPLHPTKLIDVGFLQTNRRMTRSRMQKLFEVQGATPTTHSFVEMTEEHVEGVHTLLVQYLTASSQNFRIHANFTEHDIAHWLLPRSGVINTYVVVAADDKEEEEHNNSNKLTITDLVSFNHVPHAILNKKHTNKDSAFVYVAYSYYNVATSMPLSALMRDALILAKRNNVDIYQVLNIMENATFFDELKFEKSSGKNLQYYIYNWSGPTMTPSEIGLDPL